MNPRVFQGLEIGELRKQREIAFSNMKSVELNAVFLKLYNNGIQVADFLNSNAEMRTPEEFKTGVYAMHRHRKE